MIENFFKNIFELQFNCITLTYRMKIIEKSQLQWKMFANATNDKYFCKIHQKISAKWQLKSWQKMTKRKLFLLQDIQFDNFDDFPVRHWMLVSINVIFIVKNIIYWSHWRLSNFCILSRSTYPLSSILCPLSWVLWPHHG